MGMGRHRNIFGASILFWQDFVNFSQILRFVLNTLVLEPDLDLILGHANHQCHMFLQAGVHALTKMFLEEELLFLGVHSTFLPLLPWSLRLNLLVTFI